jgi:hypothetical protein
MVSRLAKGAGPTIHQDNRREAAMLRDHHAEDGGCSYACNGGRPVTYAVTEIMLWLLNGILPHLSLMAHD